MHPVRFSTFAVVLALLALPASAAEGAPPSEHCPHHAAPAAATPYARSLHSYRPPDVTLVDQDGRRVPLSAALRTDVPVAVNFIFTTCTTVCPVMSATFAGVRRRLGADGERLQMVSISIDPERDRPAALKSYAARFGAQPAWRFYTGTTEDVRSVLAAFNVLAGDKSNHRPVTLLRPAGGQAWIRIDGLSSSEALAAEVRGLLASR
ncbi:MAG: SCO family protein [Deltaproteobacteria bacterium]|nr:SCO family protein [Deltaproteobacteria bacterium]